MAGVRQLPTGSWEVDLRSKLLPRRRTFTFGPDQEQQARDFADTCDKYFKAGIVPPQLIDETPRQVAGGLIGPVLRGWLNTGQASRADAEVLEALFDTVAKVKLSDFNYAWCEGWVRDMKLKDNLAPGTIRKKVQALAKAVDWHLRQSEGAMLGNPLRLLPKGYSSYTEKDAETLAVLGDGKQVKHDVTRDRRLHVDEEPRILAALRGDRRAGKERPLELPDGEAMLVLFTFIVNSGVRLREAYTLVPDRVHLDRRVVTVRKSKMWRGKVVYRHVPIAPALYPMLKRWMEQLPEGAATVFPFWNGAWDDVELKAVTNRLSHRFAGVFAYAECGGMTEHDLRHEATCRWLEMRAPDGGWLYREEEINRIMGWAPGSAMAKRYASFRAEDLAVRMWRAPALRDDDARKRVA